MQIQRYTAFSAQPEGGNPAGVVILDQWASDAEMQATATSIGYSETVFAVPDGTDAFRVRYFSPVAEVDFCGHATIALAIAVADPRVHASLTLKTNVGDVAVSVDRNTSGLTVATLTSAKAEVHPIDVAQASELLVALRLSQLDLDPRFPIAIGDSGNLHPIVVLRDSQRLAALDYDDESLRDLSLRHRWVTIQVVHRGEDGNWSSRNPFPFGGIREDPATGSAAIALGSYLRELDAVAIPGWFTIEQGREMGRPGLLTVHIDNDRGPIRVSGTAVAIE